MHHLHRWRVRVRVYRKSTKKTFYKSDVPCSLFSFDCCDDSDETRVTAYAEACDYFYDSIKVGVIYEISKGMVVDSKPESNGLPSNGYEIRLTTASVVEPANYVAELDDKIPIIRCKFVRLKNLKSRKSGDHVGVYGLIYIYLQTSL